ncbi:hypothetical protein, partial [Actinoalloteichus spitiensis]|uniref:hypothetical protein n=1 Tax=Actinoalloteichus spitiensis TaxID=252394 RepID=UPI0005858D01
MPTRSLAGRVLRAVTGSARPLGTPVVRPHPTAGAAGTCGEITGGGGGGPLFRAVRGLVVPGRAARRRRRTV